MLKKTLVDFLLNKKAILKGKGRLNAFQSIFILSVAMHTTLLLLSRGGAFSITELIIHLFF